MRNRYKFSGDEEIYFVTATIVEWLSVFISDKYFQILVESLKYCQHHKYLKIHAYVFMIDHIHMVVSGPKIGDIIKSFKMFTAKKIVENLEEDHKSWHLDQLKFFKKKYKIKSEYQIWQEGVHPQLVSFQKAFLQKVNYIHNNPVRKGYVEEPEFWKYSSASYYIENRKGPIQIDDLADDQTKQSFDSKCFPKQEFGNEKLPHYHLVHKLPHHLLVPKLPFGNTRIPKTLF
ncbi:MAG: transposase [Candidatus Cloacimonetes bacterium]|nr:transposase [Candidatus Cloacimonadota bacterium]MCF7815131.1 transposase [Candidatus Cloacimonadota bacterium]MCF7869352.1 transposase [Candidatus Cloacimonadota bacterium]MCF7884747.1 transposase [Candidatus Cloacimonadota bacterium]